MLYLWCGILGSAGQKCLEATPLVCEHQGKLQGLIFYRSDHVPTADSIIKLTEKYHIPGLQGFRLVALGPQSPDILRKMTNPSYPNILQP